MVGKLKFNKGHAKQQGSESWCALVKVLLPKGSQTVRVTTRWAIPAKAKVENL